LASLHFSALPLLLKARGSVQLVMGMCHKACCIHGIIFLELRNKLLQDLWINPVTHNSNVRFLVWTVSPIWDPYILCSIMIKHWSIEEYKQNYTNELHGYLEFSRSVFGKCINTAYLVISSKIVTHSGFVYFLLKTLLACAAIFRSFNCFIVSSLSILGCRSLSFIFDSIMG